MALNERQNHAMAVLARIETLAAALGAGGSHTEMLHGEEITCTVKYSRGAKCEKAYWKRNGDRVSARSLVKYFKYVCRDMEEA